MTTPFLEKIDVFLPGQGETLAQSPAYRWLRVREAVAHVYYSTTEPKSVLLHMEGMPREEVEGLADLTVEVDYSGRRVHDCSGFGLHLPGLLVTQQGTAIAICQKRHHSMADSGNQIDILTSRSADEGRSWQPQTVIFAEAGTSAILGAVFAERATGVLFIAFWKMPADVRDDLGYFSEHARLGGGFWLLKSTDDGASWSKPFHIEPAPNDDGWMAWPNNCVHGIQLDDGPHAGRIVIPAFSFKEGEPGQVPGVRGGLLYSDDQGTNWQAGAVLPEGSDEVSLVETAQGGIYVSYRMNSRRTGKRHFARSPDGGQSFCRHGQHEDLPCRNLHAGLAPYSDGAESLILFSNPPAGSPATNMTIRMSQDQGETWPVFRVLDPGPCRYSDLAVSAGGTILCLYTNGELGDRDRISVARFNMEWLLTDRGENG